jgi:hypothetical protein
MENDHCSARSEDASQRATSRRAALTKLGLTALVAYAAPSVVHLARANQSQPSKNCGKRGQPPCG